MSCVLRLSAKRFATVGLVPYRVGAGVAHFEVSSAGFDNLARQIADAVAYLDSNEDSLNRLMGEAGATGVLDFAVEWRDAFVQSSTFSVELVRAAGRIGLSLELTHYPGAEPSRTES